jgi:hypothetical protein
MKRTATMRMINRHPKLTQYVYHSLSCTCTAMEMLAARTARWRAIVYNNIMICATLSSYCFSLQIYTQQAKKRLFHRSNLDSC